MLFVFFAVTVCECHIEVRGYTYLLTYLLTYFFTARRYASAVLAVVMCPSVRLSQAGTTKTANVGLRK